MSDFNTFSRYFLRKLAKINKEQGSMNISIKNIKELDCICDALILPFTEGDSELYDNLDAATSKLIKRLFSKEFHGKQNEVFLIPAHETIKPERILLVGLGKKEDISSEKVRQAGGKSTVYLRNMGMKRIALSTSVISSLNLSPVDFIEGSLLGLYTFKKYVQEKDKKQVESIFLLSKSSKNLRDELQRTKAITSSVWFGRDLINTPSNDMTPTHLANVALSLKQKNLSVKVLEKNDVQRLGMGSYLSVAKGSKELPKFIVLEYKGAQEAPIVLIGKSITFDSGGISLKPADSMEKMKYDMAGGAAVLGILKAVSEMKLPVNLVGILPATENMPGGSATKPGDVVRAINGKTIEIINTDAEGRMILADAIAYAKRFKPQAIIDIATLTGACSIAFGNEAIAMMGNDRELIDSIKKSADRTYERVWEMPLFEEYKEYLKSDIADIKNTGGKNGSLITSAYFLYEFAGDVPWVHLDIAGTAWVEKEKPYIPKGASGIGIRLLLDFIKNM
ncbi:MAG: leucyl aminopeptidase [Nitrospira sp.]|nr:leucyl aminopeptidase [Nitrospira sp.]